MDSPIGIEAEKVMNKSKLELLKGKIKRRSPDEEAVFLKKIFKDKLGLDIESRQAAMGSSMNRYGIGLSVLFILTGVSLLFFLHPVVYITLLFLIAIGCIVSFSSAIYLYFDNEKIIKIQEEGFFHVIHQTDFIYYQDIYQVKIRSNSRKGLYASDYRVTMKSGNVLSFNLSWDANAVFINRFETHLKKAGRKFGFTIKC